MEKDGKYLCTDRDRYSVFFERDRTVTDELKQAYLQEKCLKNTKQILFIIKLNENKRCFAQCIGQCSHIVYDFIDPDFSFKVAKTIVNPESINFISWQPISGDIMYRSNKYKAKKIGLDRAKTDVIGIIKEFCGKISEE